MVIDIFRLEDYLQDAHLVYEGGIDALYDIVNYTMNLKEALCQTFLLLEEATEKVLRFIKIGYWIPEFSNNFQGGK